MQLIMILLVYISGIIAVAMGWALNYRGDWDKFANEFNEAPFILLTMAFWPIAAIVLLPFVLIRNVIFPIAKKGFARRSSKKQIDIDGDTRGSYR